MAPETLAGEVKDFDKNLRERDDFGEKNHHRD